MKAAAPAADVVASPCINVCRMDPASDLCVGCARTIDEIAAWSALDGADRRLVLMRIAQRRAVSRPTGEPPGR